MGRYKAVVVGASSGGIAALKTILSSLPEDFNMPVIIVQHIASSSGNYWIDLFDKQCLLRVKEADEKEKIEPGVVYIAPPNYHLLVERDETFSLSTDERVNYARPSIDVLFESAAEAYRETLIGIILTGANNDGAMGMKAIKEQGGLTIIQDPVTAESEYMPAAAMETIQADYIAHLNKISDLLLKISS